MNKSKNIIKVSEASTTPVKLKYSSSYGIDSFSTYGISTSRGTNGPITITGSVKQSTIKYAAIKQLYYKNYLTGSLNFSSSGWDWNQQSTACSGSSDYENRYFPTQSDAVIGIISVPPKVFGEQISRNTLVLKPESGTNYLITDDGNGNLIDRKNSSHVGNVIYSQGVIVITNPDYSSGFFQNQLMIIVKNEAIKAVNSISLDSGAVTYTGGTFPLTIGNSTTIYPNSYNIESISSQLTILATGNYCVRSKHVNKDENGNVLNIYTENMSVNVPNPPFVGFPPVTFNVELNFGGTIDQYSYLEYTVKTGTCT
jgi:hypothetical protein